MDPFLKRRRTLALTAGVTIVTVSGALIGATLKSKQQISAQEPTPALESCEGLQKCPANLSLFPSTNQEQKKNQQSAEVTVDQQIALLEATKGQLSKQRQTLEAKIVEVKEKAKKREEVEKERRERLRRLSEGSSIK